MDLVLPHRSRTNSCLGRNVIRLQASHTRSAPGNCPWPATVSDLVDVPAADHLQTYNSRKGNATKFRVPYARTVAYGHSFFLDVTRMWNALSPDVLTAESIDVFKKDYLCSRSGSESKHTSDFVYIWHNTLF